MNNINSRIKNLTFVNKIPFEIYLSIIWLFSILLVNPFGNFPLNDDWAYAKSVWNLCEQGKLSIGNWPAMTLIGQTLPGALVCYIFGFSFVLLRFYTLIISLIGVITFYNLTKHFTSNRKLIAFTCLLFFFHPLYFSLSFTFMTDVHFLTIMLLSIFFFNKYILKGGYSSIILATIFSVICTMIRQPGLVVPLGFTLTIFFSKRNRISKISSSIPFIITLLSLIIHSFWLNQFAESSRNVVEINNLQGLFHSLDLYRLLVRISKSMLYVGLFSFPIVFLFWKNIKHNFKTSIRTSLIIGIIIIPLLLIGGVHFPTGNIFYNLGLGPKLLHNGYLNKNLNPQINHELWIIALKTISILASLGLIFLFFRKKNYKNNALQNTEYQNASSLKLFIFLTLMGYLSLLVLSSSYFDRYTIPLFACLTLLLLSFRITFTKSTTLMAIIGLLIISFFSISATHDYLSWNRARWDSLNYLTENKKIKLTEIDGGFEFNAWHKTGDNTYNKTDKEDKNKSWWFVNNDEYVISFGEIDGFQIIKGFHYPKILSFKNDSVFILRKK